MDRRTGHRAGRSRQWVRADPVFGLGQEDAVADLGAEQFGQSGWPERAGAVVPAAGRARRRPWRSVIGGGGGIGLEGLEAIPPVPDQELGPVGQSRPADPDERPVGALEVREHPAVQSTDDLVRDLDVAGRDPVVEREAEVALGAADDKPAVADPDDLAVPLAVVIDGQEWNGRADRRSKRLRRLRGSAVLAMWRGAWWVCRAADPPGRRAGLGGSPRPSRSRCRDARAVRSDPGALVEPRDTPFLCSQASGLAEWSSLPLPAKVFQSAPSIHVLATHGPSFSNVALSGLLVQPNRFENSSGVYVCIPPSSCWAT